MQFVPMGSIDNRSALDQVKAWHWYNQKPLPKPMLIQLSDLFMHHWVSMS